MYICIVKNRVFLLLLYIVSYNTVFSFTLKGTIKDIHDNSPLDYAVIYWHESSEFYYTDSMGTFVIPNIQEGVNTLSISHINCNDTLMRILIQGDTNMVIKIEHHNEMLEELVVHAHDIRQLDGIKTLEGKALQSSSGSLGNVIAEIPGAAITQSGPNIYKPILHSLFGDRILIAYNDIALRSQDWGAEHSPELDITHAQTIEVYSGANTVQTSVAAYGGTIAIHDIDLGNMNTWKSTSQISSESNSLLWGASQRWQQNKLFKKDNILKYMVQGSFYKNRDSKAPYYALYNTATQKASASAYFVYNRNIGDKFLKNTVYYAYYNNATAILRNAHIGNIEDLYSAIANNIPVYSGTNDYKQENPRQHTAHHNAYLSHEFHWKHHHQVLLSYNFQNDNRKEYDIRRGNRSEIPALDMQLFTNEIKFSYQLHKDIFLVKTGTDFLYIINNNSEDLGIKPLVPNYVRRSFAQWGFAEFSLPKEQILQVGYRWQTEGYHVFTFDKNNNNVTLSHHYLGASIALTYSVEKNKFSIFQDIQFRRRPPNVAELYSQGLHHGAAAIEYGNSNLLPENVFSLQQTLQVKPCKFYQISILPYYFNIHNFIYLQPRPEPVQTIRGAYFAYDYHQSNVQILGLDIMQKITLLSNVLYWHSNFSGNRSFIAKRKSFLPYMPQTHLSNALAFVWHFRKNIDKLNINLEYDYYFEKRKYTSSFEVIPPPKGYGLLNLDATLTWRKNVHDMSWIFGVHNLLNTTYRNYTDRFRYFSDASGINIVTTLIYSLHNKKS